LVVWGQLFWGARFFDLKKKEGGRVGVGVGVFAWEVDYPCTPILTLCPK
jgi:hypothetical protein